MGERRTALEELRMLFARARASFVINMWEGEAKVGLLIDLAVLPDRQVRTHQPRLSWVDRVDA